MNSPGLIHRFAHQAMKTVFEITIADEDGTYAGQAAQEVFKEIDRIESLFSRFNSTSEISRINRLLPGESLLVGIETFECLTIAERVRMETSGAFDANVRALSRHENSKSQGLSQIHSSDGNSVTDSGNSLELIRTGNGFEAALRPGKAGSAQALDIDLGGIGKGYALDKTPAILADWSIENALIHSGTSTAVAVGSAPAIPGTHHLIDQISNSPSNFEQLSDVSPKSGWPVGVGGGWPCPDAPREIHLSGRAVSGSGMEVKGRHIIDPRTGLPAKGHVAAWASHSSAAVADALSTAFMVMDTEEVENYCRRYPGVWALVVRDYGDCRVFGRL